MMVDEEYLNLFDKPKTKACSKCKEDKLLTEFWRDNRLSHGLQAECKACMKKRDLKFRKEKPFDRRCVSIKRHATKKKVPFNLTAEYLESIWTKKCPILGLELDINSGKTRKNSAQIDRLVPDKGYVKGNVSWLSFRANQLKSNGTAKEHMQIAQWMLGQSDDS